MQNKYGTFAGAVILLFSIAIVAVLLVGSFMEYPNNNFREQYAEAAGTTPEYEKARLVAGAINADIDTAYCADYNYPVLISAEVTQLVCFNPWGLILREPVRWDRATVEPQHQLFYFPIDGKVRYFVSSVGEGESYDDMSLRVTIEVINSGINLEQSIGGMAITQEQYEKLVNNAKIPEWSAP